MPDSSLKARSRVVYFYFPRAKILVFLDRKHSKRGTLASLVRCWCRYVYWTMEDVQAVSNGHTNPKNEDVSGDIPAVCDGYKLTERVDLFRARCDHSTSR